MLWTDTAAQVVIAAPAPARSPEVLPCPPAPSSPIAVRVVTVLAAAVCAVLAGARSYTVIAEWVHDLPVSVRLRLGMGRATPSESTFRRILQRVDADELDTAVSGWLARRVADAGPQRPAGRRCTIRTTRRQLQNG